MDSEWKKADKCSKVQKMEEELWMLFSLDTHKKVPVFIYFFASIFWTKIIYLFYFYLSFSFLTFFGFWKLGGRGVFDDNKRLNGPARRMMIRGKTERKTIIKVAMSISSFPIYYLAFYRHLNVSFFIFISDHFLSWRNANELIQLGSRLSE